MYIDLIIVVLLLLLVIFVFRKFSSFVYAFAIIDIFLRILFYIKEKIPIRELDNIFPSSIQGIFKSYTKDIIYDILDWFYIFVMTCFLVYTFIYFIHKKKKW